jgi:hypothetical protein
VIGVAGAGAGAGGVPELHRGEYDRIFATA